MMSELKVMRAQRNKAMSCGGISKWQLPQPVSEAIYTPTLKCLNILLIKTQKNITTHFLFDKFDMFSVTGVASSGY